MTASESPLATRQLVRDVDASSRAEPGPEQLCRQFRHLLARSSDVITLLESDGGWRYSSPAGTRLLGYPTGYDPEGGIFSLIHPDDVAAALGAVAEVLDGRRGPDDTLLSRVRSAEGSWRWFESVAVNMVSDPDVHGVIVTSRDVTERIRIEQTRQSAERLYRMAFTYSTTPMVVLTLGLQVKEVNRAFQEFVDRPTALLTNADLRRMVHPEDYERVSGALMRLTASGSEQDEPPFEARMRGAGDRVTTVRIDGSVALDQRGEPDRVALAITDLTPPAAVATKVRSKAGADRAGKDDGVQDRMAAVTMLQDLAGESELITAVLSVGLEGAAATATSTRGAILSEIAKRLCGIVRGDDIVTSNGDSDFLVVCLDVGSKAGGLAVARRIGGAFSREFTGVNGPETHTASIGVALSGAAETAESLILRAERAMDEGKRLGTGRTVLARDDD
jgi:PAS domain S-box-containing protein